MNMHAAKFGAAVQRRKHLAGIEQALVVERALEPLLLVEIGLGEHCGHKIAFLYTYAVLAGEHAAHMDARHENSGDELFGTLELAWLVRVVENERMEVAVAGMEHIGDGKPIGLGQFAYAFEDLRQPRPRDGAVHAVIVGRDAADCREGRLAAGPEQKPLLFGARGTASHGAAGFSHALQAPTQMIDLP